VDRLGNVAGDIERDFVIEPFGKILTDLFHRFAHLPGHFDGIRTGKGINPEYCGIFTVHTTLGGIGRSLERDPGNVPQTYDRTVWIRSDHNLFEFIDCRQTPLGSDRNGYILPGNRLLAQFAGRRLTVLVFEGILQIFYRQSEISHPVGHHPDTHTIITASDIGNPSYPGDTPQDIQDIDRRKITEVDFVETGIVGSQGQGHELIRRLLFDGNTVLHHLGGQARLGQFHPVLDFYGR